MFRLQRFALTLLPTLFFLENPNISYGAQAVPVNDFLNSTGINTHMGQGVSESTYEEGFKYTGIRNARDYLRAVSALIALHRSTIMPGVYPGVRVDVLTGSLDTMVSDATTLASADVLLALEGPNEPNNFSITYNGQRGGGHPTGTWMPVAQYQRDLYSMVKASPILAIYPVFNVSEGGAETDNVGLQWLTIPSGAGTLMPDGTRYADYANTHNYVCDHTAGVRDNQAWDASDPTANREWDGIYGEYHRTWAHGYEGYAIAELAALPKVTTETGYSTGPVGNCVIPEEQQGKVYLNLFLSAFKRGWRYTFIYQMHDKEGGDNDFGIYHTDLTPKIAATYLHNLTTILADVVSNTTGSINYSIPGKPATMHDLLMQKSDGTFYLAVWDELAPGTGSDNVIVKLDNTYASLKVYDPTVGPSVTQSFTNADAITLTLSDHPVILSISR
jgi:hypothetical protein